jgi:pyroglutamyl-peptidase
MRRNPSGEVAIALGGHVLPVRYDAAERALARLLDEIRPEAILLLGLAPGRRRIALETLAINVDYCEEGSERRRSRRIRKRGPLALRTRLPIERLQRRLRRAGIPVTISHHAGTFICNHVFYAALSDTRVPCGFIHVPPETVMPLGRQVRAIRQVLGEIERLAR